VSGFSTIDIKQISKILSINKIHNVGLLNVEEKIDLNLGINVFYGQF
jgi:hypothetical protein